MLDSGAHDESETVRCGAGICFKAKPSIPSLYIEGVAMVSADTINSAQQHANSGNGDPPESL